MVNESDVVPQQYLPIFSSLVLEAYLHRIPGTSLGAVRCAQPATSALPALLHTSCAPRTIQQWMLGRNRAGRSPAHHLFTWRPFSPPSFPVLLEYVSYGPLGAMPPLHSQPRPLSAPCWAGLAEYFIYFNDDVLLAQPFPKSLVFTETPGVAAVFMMPWIYIGEYPPPGAEHLWRWVFWNRWGRGVGMWMVCVRACAQTQACVCGGGWENSIRSAAPF